MLEPAKYIIAIGDRYFKDTANRYDDWLTFGDGLYKAENYYDALTGSLNHMIEDIFSC